MSAVLTILGLSALIAVAVLLTRRRRRSQASRMRQPIKDPGGLQTTRSPVSGPAQFQEGVFVSSCDRGSATEEVHKQLVVTIDQRETSEQSSQPVNLPTTVPVPIQSSASQASSLYATDSVLPQPVVKADEFPLQEERPEATPENYTDSQTKPPGLHHTATPAQLPPLMRGGRPRRSGTAPPFRQKESTSDIKIREQLRKPEIVCWRHGNRWVIGVEIDDAHATNKSFVALQNGTQLSIDLHSEGLRYPLSCLDQELLTRWTIQGHPKEARIELPRHDCLVFRLAGPNLSRGRLVRKPSVGSLLVVAPDGWGRDNTMSGVSIITPEPVSISGYLAHHFFFAQSEHPQISFVTSDVSARSIDLLPELFELEGQLVQDAAEQIGPLFAAEPPSLRARDQRYWDRVGSIVIGQEGPGKNKWRTVFTLDRGPDQLSHELQSTLRAREGGWYFARVYDQWGDLIESLDFRFLASLRAIRIGQYQTLPPPEGHAPVPIEFLHDQDCIVRQQKSEKCELDLNSESETTSVLIPPRFECDLTNWVVGPRAGCEVPVRLRIDRVWWTGDTGSYPAPKWTDKPLHFARGQFSRQSTAAFWLRLPHPGWTGAVNLGVSEQLARNFSIPVDKTEVCFPLGEFADQVGMPNSPSSCNLGLWVERNGVKATATLACISSDADAQPVLAHGKSEPRAPADPRALCNGGSVAYGHCRHCRRLLAEVNSNNGNA